MSKDPKSPNLRPPSAAVLGAALALGACSTTALQSAYKERDRAEESGYTDIKLSANRYRVTFTGDGKTTEPEIKDYLLRRAAEVTLAAGYTHFVFDDRGKEPTTYSRHVLEPAVPNPVPPSEFFGRSRFWFPPPATVVTKTLTVTNTTFFSEIVLLRPDQADGNPNALAARDILKRLGVPGVANGPRKEPPA